MSLEKSTPYRNAWYRDLLEKEAELKQYTDDKVAQAIELPEVTSEDNGDLLAADDGSWVKSDKLKTIMNAGVEEVGKIPMVGAQGSWTLTDYPSNELPSVTSADNGKVAGVVDGNWNTMDVPNELPAVTAADDGDILSVVNGEWTKSTPTASEMVVFKAVINSSHLDLSDNKTIGDILTAISSGKGVTIETNNVNFVLTEKANTTNNLIFTSVVKDIFVNDYNYLLAYALKSQTTNTYLTIREYRFVPFTTSTYQIPVTDNGVYKLQSYPLLPVSTSDNGKILAVVNGAWAKSVPNLIKSIQFVNGQALSDVDYALIKADTNVRGIYSDASKYIIFELSSCNFAQTEFEFVNYAEGLKATIDTTKVVTIASI